MRKVLLLILMCVATLCACHRNRRFITPHCYLQKEAQSYSLVMNGEDVHDTITQVTRIGWQNDWVYVWGYHAQTGRKGWVHIWDNVVLKYYGPIAEEQSYYGRKNVQEYEVEEAWKKLE